jgi:hypothetical protein
MINFKLGLVGKSKMDQNKFKFAISDKVTKRFT